MATNEVEPMSKGDTPDETDAQRATIPAGAAMGTDDADDTEDRDDSAPVPDADRIDYDEMVRQAAHYVVDGVYELQALDPKEYHDVTAEQFRGDVEDMLSEVAAETYTPEADESDAEQTATGVNWPALWTEFGFDSSNVDGNEWVSKIQLFGALQSSEQGISGSAAGHKEKAIEENVLTEVQTENGVTRGYVYVGGEL